MRKVQIIILSSLLVISVIVFAGMYYHQSTHFNSNITINHIKVGGLTAEEALEKLKKTVLKNEVYVGTERVLDGKDTKMTFSKSDITKIKEVIKKQQTIWPSSKKKDYLLFPGKIDQERTQALKKQLEDKLTSLNKTLQAPKDATVQLEQGEVKVAKSVDGKQLDVSILMKAYDKQAYTSEIHLNPVYIQPLREDSEVIKNEKKTLKELLQQTIEYKVQDKVYSFDGKEMIKNATITKEMKVTIDTDEIKKKISEINDNQSTLGKKFQFTTHSGSVISVQGESYGWAMNVAKETERVKEAFEKGESSLEAKAVYGRGWSLYGIGYKNTTNNGIGDTYAEVSIDEQRIWLYRDGKMVFTTHVVTGRHNTHEDTPKGVWYVEYKESPSILEGSEVGNLNYSVKVNYWAPFTLGGEGFHDASWRRNWASDAYLTAGSGGCVNTPADVMKTVYDILIKDQPVIVY